MILSSVQSKQYYRVFNSFLMFLMDWFKEQGLLDDIIDPSHVYREYEAESALLEAVFGEDGHREVIDAFVDAKRGSLSREDLDVALDYKHAIPGEFYAVRKGADVYFLEGAYAYAVRGITHELDDRFLDLPMHVFTYLVPFHNYITYLTVMRPLSTRLPKREEISLLDRITEAEKDGCLIRTGDDLRSLSEDFGTGERQDLIPEALRNLASEHVGVLAGLSWDERQAEIARHRNLSTDHEAVLKRIDDFSLPGEPVHAYRDLMARCSLDILRRFARAHDVYDELSKEAYIDLLADIFKPSLPKVIDDLRKLGIRFLTVTRDLCEHEGELHIQKDAIMRHEDVPSPVFPHVEYFDNGLEYVVVLSDEMRLALEGVDWEAEMARAERLEEALAFLDVATDYRGIIARGEALREVAHRFGDIDVAEIEDAVERRSVNRLLHTHPITLNGREYFAADNLVTDDGEVSADTAWEIIAKRKALRPVWPTLEQVAQGRLVDAWASYEEGRRLAAYLDAHVLDIMDDYDYASHAMSMVLKTMQTQPKGLAGLEMVMMLLARGDGQREELMPLFQNLYNVLPNRYFNGSVPQRRQEVVVTPRKPKKKRPTKKRRR